MSTSAMWRLAAAGFTLALLVAGVIVTWALVRPQGEIHRETESESISHNVTRLVFDDFEASDVVVESREGAGVVGIQRHFKWAGDKPKFTQSWAGDTLTIGHNCGNSNSDECSIKFVVTVPPGTEVQAETASGDITVSGIAGPAKLTSVSGDLRTERLTGKLDLKTVSGDLTADATGSTLIKANTVSGDLAVSYISAPKELTAETTSGDLRVAVPASSGPYRVQANTVSGEQRITVDTSASSDRVVKVKTVSGDLYVDYR